MPQLIAPGPTFYSQTDEASFFARLESIPGVVRVVGEHRSLIVTLRSAGLSKSALRELLALYFRYNLPMKALARFETLQNALWFCEPKMFWYKKVFGKSRR
jgi:hypothetical protein